MIDKQNHPDNLPELVSLLVKRLERISADSYWAHRASGIRGALLDAQAKIELGEPVAEENLHSLLSHGYKLLERAAREKRARSR
jgi:hypothetical protein